MEKEALQQILDSVAANDDVDRLMELELEVEARANQQVELEEKLEDIAKKLAAMQLDLRRKDEFIKILLLRRSSRTHRRGGPGKAGRRPQKTGRARETRA
eukprot:GEMP01142088.1.p2 GENE.GEMP01142088.1~~GEMP01142088.1.p2  ORF type:complete len:100 (+),score=28.16 GEMP01142088.1:89-388(+)